MKWIRLIVVIVLAAILVSGCLPKLKNTADFTPPSWLVSVKVPLIKQNVLFSEYLEESLGKTEGMVIDPNTHTYNFTFKNENITIPMPDLSAINIDAFSFDAYTWTQGEISVKSGISGVGFHYGIEEYYGTTVSDEILPVQLVQTVKYSRLGSYITQPFTRVKLSASPTNKIDFTLTTDEPVDFLEVKLMDKQGNIIGDPISFSIENPAASLPEAVSETKSINLAGEVLPQELDFELTITSHSSAGNIDFTINMSDQIEIVELEGFDPVEVGMTLPTIDLPIINPLESLPGITEIKFQSGKLKITQDTSLSNNDHPFPFSFKIQEFCIDGINRVQVDPDGYSYIDLTNTTLTQASTITGKVEVKFNNPLSYDVWNDAQRALKAYVYEVGFVMENVVAESIFGDIKELLPDPNPDTPGIWDLKLDSVNTEIQEVEYPDEIKDFNIGFSDLFLALDLDNNTSFKGDFIISIKVHPDAVSPATDNATFTLTIQPHSNSVFDFSKQPDYAKFKQIINQRPKFVSFGFEGSFSVDDNASITQQDKITPSLSLSVPVAFTVGENGAILHNVLKQTMNLSQQEKDTFKMIDELVESASLHIKYNNISSLGFGGIFNFSTPEGAKHTVQAILYDNRESEIVLTVDNALLAILANQTGFEISCDLIIPNDSGAPRSMALKSTDNLDLTIWFDGKILAHVPVQN